MSRIGRPTSLGGPLAVAVVLFATAALAQVPGDAGAEASAFGETPPGVSEEERAPFAEPPKMLPGTLIAFAAILYLETSLPDMPVM